MAQLLVRELDPELVDRLKRRAAANGRSTEAEHREILRLHLTSEQPPRQRSLTEALASMPYFKDDELFYVR